MSSCVGPLGSHQTPSRHTCPLLSPRAPPRPQSANWEAEKLRLDAQVGKMREGAARDAAARKELEREKAAAQASVVRRCRLP